ncbi:MAG: hypothetical protein GM43_3900 [actinobacterium acMicro-4]|nr:MAG: hypothetical protein GM43_3900 [actinobacterium acMicro-4]
MFRCRGCVGSAATRPSGTLARFRSMRVGATVSSGSREVVAQQAHQLRRIAGNLVQASSVSGWGGPSQRECARQVTGLEGDLRDVARALGVAGEYAGIHSVMARL